MSDPVVKLLGATRHYRTRAGTVRAIDGIDLCIGARERVAVMGPSGSGKSTLLALIGGLELATTGVVEVLDTKWSALSDEARSRMRGRHLGFVFQNLDLLPFLTAAENVEFAIGVSRARDALDARALLRSLGLAAHADRLVEQLSGGEQERVAIARSLVHRPQLVLGDEPTGSLDAATSELAIGFFLDAVRELDAACVVVTHDRAIAEHFDRIVELHDGHVGARDHETTSAEGTSC